jgi:hypothetical protein
MTEKGKEKLEAYGIAPPKRKSSNPLALFEEDTVTCPKCKSDDTVLTSQFGATSCKALYKCNHCKNATNIVQIRIPYAFKLLTQACSQSYINSIHTIFNSFHFTG